MGLLSRRGWLALALGVAAVVLVASIVLLHAGPSVPGEKNDSMTMSPGHVHAGRSVAVRYDYPVDAGASDTLFFSRWDGSDWGDLNLLTAGQWSDPVGDGQFSVITSVAGREVTSWTLEVPTDVPAGTYLVCDTDENCGLLTVD